MDHANEAPKACSGSGKAWTAILLDPYEPNCRDQFDWGISGESLQNSLRRPPEISSHDLHCLILKMAQKGGQNFHQNKTLAQWLPRDLVLNNIWQEEQPDMDTFACWTSRRWYFLLRLLEVFFSAKISRALWDFVDIATASKLPVDCSLNNLPRVVSNAIFCIVPFSPLRNPRVVATSQTALALLGLESASVEVFAGNAPIPNCIT